VSLLAITVHGGIRLAELGFLLTAVAGAAIVLAVLAPAMRTAAALIAGAALAAGSVLVIVALHWGHFGLG
jgi:hypothetical protein